MATLSDFLVHAATMLVINNMDESVKFYTHYFGFTIREHLPYIALLEQWGMLLYLVTESPPTPDKPAVTLANINTPDKTSVNLVFRVSDCRAAYEALREQGIDFLTPPQQPEWGGWRCFTRDPNGYLIEIEEP